MKNIAKDLMKSFLTDLKFLTFYIKICWARAAFEKKKGCKPTRLFLSGEVFDFFYVYICKNGFLGDRNFESVFDDVFGVYSLSRSNGIKFARYE